MLQVFARRCSRNEFLEGSERGFAAWVDFFNLTGGLMYGLKPVPFKLTQYPFVRLWRGTGEMV
jgi:hypothetical protein